MYADCDPQQQNLLVLSCGLPAATLACTVMYAYQDPQQCNNRSSQLHATRFAADPVETRGPAVTTQQLTHSG